MRVIEKDTDRWAEVHIGVQGIDGAREEYGEEFDEDGALACYVPVEVGQKVSVTARFGGTVRSTSPYTA